MPTDIKIHKRYWDQPYSLARAHSGSNDPNVGGNVTFGFGANAWAPPMVAYFSDVYHTAGGNSNIYTDHGRQIIQNLSPGELYTTPYDGLGAVVCEATPGSTWDWSINVRNMSENGQASTIDITLSKPQKRENKKNNYNSKIQSLKVKLFKID